MNSRSSILAELLYSRIADAKAGHCLRVDDLTLSEATELQISFIAALADLELKTPVDVRVLDVESGQGRVTIEEAVGLRNDVALPDSQASILVLLVPPTLAREASSLDNAFERTPYGELLTGAAEQVIAQIKATRPTFPVNELFRLTNRRIAIEHWLEFLESVAEAPGETFGNELWRVGLVPDGGDDDDVRARLRGNDSFVRRVVDPTGAGHAVGDRLRKTRLAPGAQFDDVLNELIGRQDRLHDVRAWTKAIADGAGLRFDQFQIVKEDDDSDLENMEVLSFRAAGGLPNKASGLTDVNENLVCQIPDGGEGRVVIRWRTTPAKTSQVHRWQLRLIHPDDLRARDEVALVETKVAGSRRSATLKLELESSDVTGGRLFVIEVLPLDRDGIEMEVPESAVIQSEAFELVFGTDDFSPETNQPLLTSISLGSARLQAVTKGADSLEEDHVVWDWNRQIFSLRIGGTRRIQIPANQTVFDLQRRIINDPGITSFEAHSPYGLPLETGEFKGVRSELPAAFLKKREQILEMLRLAPDARCIPEVFPWSEENAAIRVREYLASYKRTIDSADAPMRDILQRLDTIELSFGKPTSSTVSIVLPLNPIRLAWIHAYDALSRAWAQELIDRADTAAGRKDQIDFDEFVRVAPTNLPFSVATSAKELNFYLDELSFGLGILLPIGHSNPEVVASTVRNVLGIARQTPSPAAGTTMVAARLVEYRKAHPAPTALRIAALNPSDGSNLSDAIARFFKAYKDDPVRIEIMAYGERDRYANPLGPLTHLQREREAEQLLVGPLIDTSNEPDVEREQLKQSPLFPPLGVALRPSIRIATDEQSIHVALATGISKISLAPTPDKAFERFASFDDLLSPLVTTNVEDDERGWTVSPALNTRTNTENANIVAAHRSQQTAAGITLGLTGPPALHVDIDGDTLDEIRVLHERSDWVLTLDRFVGLNFYESGHFGPAANNYILDYAPDFIDGMSHRLTVTTAHRREVSTVLKHALAELGLDALDSSSTQVLDDLMAVSGRLILRLQSSEGFARESVSLAALISHLRKQNKLDGAVIVPVDSHQEIFGRSALGNETGRRCDMLIVRVSQRKFRIECIEVKSRRYAVLPTDLADDIVDQLESTKALLEERYFTTDPERIDGSLQRAQLAGLLHYYADRAVSNGLISDDNIGDTHRHIDSLVEGRGVEVEISMHGYVISLGGTGGIPTKHRGVPISVLTADDLGKLGFSVTPTALTADSSSGNVKSQQGSVGAHELSPPKLSKEETPREPTEPQGEHSPPIEPNPEGRPSDRDAVTPETPAEPKPNSGAGKPAQSRPEPDYLAGARDVEVAVGRDGSGALVTWQPSTKGSPHAFIVGIPGQGKSVTTRRIIRELATQGLPSLVIDFHGDMAADPPAGAHVLNAEVGLPFTPFDSLRTDEPAKVAVAAWELAEVVQFVTKMGEIQRSNVYKALQNVYRAALTEARVPTLLEFAEALEEIESSGRGAQNARERITPLTDFGLFDENATRGFNPREAGMVVDLSKLTLEQVQIAATSFLLRKIYREMFSWPQDGTLKLAIVLDEAHRVAKDVTLPKLMKEGRKYGVIIVVASQGLSDFHKDVLLNAGMKIIFRTNHPESKAVTKYLRGRAGQDLAVEVEKLGVGQAYVATPDSPQARKTNMFE